MHTAMISSSADFFFLAGLYTDTNCDFLFPERSALLVKDVVGFSVNILYENNENHILLTCKLTIN